MALIKGITLENGIEAPEAYHVVSDVITWKNPVDKPDPDGIRPDNAPEWVWKKGYYGRICVQVWYNKAARDAGKNPILHMGANATDIPADLRVELRTEQNMYCVLDVTSTASVIDQAYAYLKGLDFYSDAIED